MIDQETAVRASASVVMLLSREAWERSKLRLALIATGTVERFEDVDELFRAWEAGDIVRVDGEQVSLGERGAALALYTWLAVERDRE